MKERNGIQSKETYKFALLHRLHNELKKLSI